MCNPRIEDCSTFCRKDGRGNRSERMLGSLGAWHAMDPFYRALLSW